MTNGLKNDATLMCDSVEQSGDGHTAPEQLVHDLLKRALIQDSLKVTEQSADTETVQPAKPARSAVDRLIKSPTRKIVSGLVSVKNAVLAYQPVPRHIAFLLMVTILLIVPWMLPSLFAIVLGLVAFTYLVIGHNYAIKLVTTWFNWLKRRDSQGAEIIRARAERVSNRLTAWLTRLPANWTNGLYLPDFAHAEDFSEKLKSDPFGRLARGPQNQ